MKIQEQLIPPVATIVGLWIGFAVGKHEAGRIDPASPTDQSGRTSIVVEYDQHDWCELRDLPDSGP